MLNARSQKRKERAARIFVEMMSPNFPNIMKNNIHIQEAQQLRSRINSKKLTLLPWFSSKNIAYSSKIELFG